MSITKKLHYKVRRSFLKAMILTTQETEFNLRQFNKSVRLLFSIRDREDLSRIMLTGKFSDKAVRKVPATFNRPDLCPMVATIFASIYRLSFRSRMMHRYPQTPWHARLRMLRSIEFPALRHIYDVDLHSINYLIKMILIFSMSVTSPRRVVNVLYSCSILDHYDASLLSPRGSCFVHRHVHTRPRAIHILAM